MKQSKTADFKELSFKATFDEGKLTRMSVSSDKGGSIFVMDAVEIEELHDWLNESVLELHAVRNKAQDDSLVVQSIPQTGANPLAKDYLGTGTPLDERSTAKVGVVAKPEKHMTDAESVAHIIPLKDALKRDGMLLESEPRNIPVTFAPGGKK